MAAHGLSLCRYEVKETTSREDLELDLRETLDGLAGWFTSLATTGQSGQREPTPPLASGLPQSAERLALIEAFRQKSGGIEEKFEARAHKSDWTMPYRLFRPSASGRIPLVVYLPTHGLLQMLFGDTAR